MMVSTVSRVAFADAIKTATIDSGEGLTPGEGTEWAATIGPSSVNPLDLGSVADWAVSYTGSVDVTGTAYYTSEVVGVGPVWEYQSSLDKISWTSIGSLFNYSDGDVITSTSGSGGTEVYARYFRIVGKFGAYTGGDDETGATVIARTTLTVDPVPEPSTIVLLGMGGFGLLAYAWRRRRS